MTAIMTIPILLMLSDTSVVNNLANDTYFHDKLLFATAASACPPRMQLRMQNPHIVIILMMQGMMTPKYLCQWM